MANVYFTDRKHAEVYAKFRPPPPLSCTEYMISYLKEKIEPPFKNAVDVGCGSGQSTKNLSPYFEKVCGLDVSEAQIDCAKKVHAAPNVEYSVSGCEKLPFESSSVQLVTFCQSVHWFNLDDIFAEVQRVLVPDGVIACYGYWIPLPIIDDEVKSRKVDELINQYLCEERLAGYWDKGLLAKDQYRNVNLPFKDSRRKNFERKTESSLADYISYMKTWSSYQKFLKKNPEEGERLLLEIQDKFISILEEDRSAEDITISLFTDYYMIIGRK